MREGIHPTYYPDAVVICGCGNTFTTGSTRKLIRTDVCSQCHPFYTGEQRIVDTAGQVERFMRRMGVKEGKVKEEAAAAQAREEADRRARDKARQERLRRAGLKRISEAMQTPSRERAEQAPSAEAVGEAVAAVEAPGPEAPPAEEKAAAKPEKARPKAEGKIAAKGKSTEQAKGKEEQS